MKLRIGSVPYLNARPLVHFFSAFESDIEVVEEVPSRLAKMLEAGEIAVGELAAPDRVVALQRRIRGRSTIRCSSNAPMSQRVSPAPFARRR